jgi:hypothetical protein
MHFIDLDSDTLTLIISSLWTSRNSRRRRELLPLSLTCRRFRQAVLPWIFATFNWVIGEKEYPVRETGFLPAHLSYVVKYVPRGYFPLLFTSLEAPVFDRSLLREPSTRQNSRRSRRAASPTLQRCSPPYDCFLPLESRHSFFGAMFPPCP